MQDWKSRWSVTGPVPNPLLSVAHRISYELPLLSTYAVLLLEGQLKLVEVELGDVLEEEKEVRVEVVDGLAEETEEWALLDDIEDSTVEDGLELPPTEELDWLPLFDETDDGVVEDELKLLLTEELDWKPLFEARLVLRVELPTYAL